jgi:hypothetical protein
MRTVHSHAPNTLFDARNWEHNDNFAQMIIMTNIEQNQSIHISQCDTAHAMWMNLEAVHESKGNLLRQSAYISFFDFYLSRVLLQSVT